MKGPGYPELTAQTAFESIKINNMIIVIILEDIIILSWEFW